MSAEDESSSHICSLLSQLLSKWYKCTTEGGLLCNGIYNILLDRRYRNQCWLLHVKGLGNCCPCGISGRSSQCHHLNTLWDNASHLTQVREFATKAVTPAEIQLIIDYKLYFRMLYLTYQCVWPSSLAYTLICSITFFV